MNRIEQPQNERSRRTRAAALDATWQLLAEVGADGTTMGAVAERAGVTRRALYLHFASRAELLLALHDHVDQSLDLDSSLRPVWDAPDSAAALEAFAAHLAEYHWKILPIDLAIARASDDPELADLIAQGTAVWHHACTTLADWLARDGRLAEPFTAETAADWLWVAMFPETLHRLTSERGWTIEQYRQVLTAQLTRTLLSRD